MKPKITQTASLFLAEFATIARETESSPHRGMPSAAFRRGDLVAAQCGVQQRRQSRPASVRKCPPVDHFGPRRRGGQAGPRPRVCGARAHSAASARHSTAPDRPGCVPGARANSPMIRLSRKYDNSRLSRYGAGRGFPRRRAFRLSHGPNHLHHETQARSGFEIHAPARDKAEDKDRRAASEPASRRQRLKNCRRWRMQNMRIACRTRRMAETHPRGIISNGLCRGTLRHEINEDKIVPSRNGSAPRIPDAYAALPRTSRRSPRARIEFAAHVAPTGGQPEPVRQLTFYLLRKSLEDIREGGLANRARARSRQIH